MWSFSANVLKIYFIKLDLAKLVTNKLIKPNLSVQLN